MAALLGRRAPAAAREKAAEERREVARGGEMAWGLLGVSRAREKRGGRAGGGEEGEGMPATQRTARLPLLLARGGRRQRRGPGWARWASPVGAR